MTKLTRVLTPGEIKKGFTGKFTSDGRALVRFQGRVFAVPAAGLSGLVKRPANQNVQNSRWSQQQKLAMASRAETLARKAKASASKGSGGGSRPPQTWRAANDNVQASLKHLDWSRNSIKGTAAEHIRSNHGNMSLSKPVQGVFYGDPVAVTEEAWLSSQKRGTRPVRLGNRDFYVVPRANSGYAGGMGGQRENYDHVTIITEAGTSKIVTAFPSGRTMPLPKDYVFVLEN